MNKALLRSHMAKRNDTQEDLANYLGISLSRLNAKINETCGAKFKQTEIAFIKKRYGLTPRETDAIFLIGKYPKKTYYKRRQERSAHEANYNLYIGGKSNQNHHTSHNGRRSHIEKNISGNPDYRRDHVLR